MRVFRFMGAIVLALVVMVVAGGVRAYAADGQMDGDPAGVIAYVREHMDGRYRDESFDMYMHDSVEYLEVRNTLVDQRLVGEGTSIDAFYEDEGWRDATYMTYSGTTPLYYASRDWLVALVDVSRVNGLRADVSDVDVAANNPYANMVDGAVYDDETGLLYVPRDVLENEDLSSKWSEEFKDGLIAQTLMRIDPTNVSCSLPVEVRRVGVLGAKTTEFLNVPFAGFDQTFMLNLGTSSAITTSDVCTFSSGSTISMMAGEGDRTLEDGVFALRITPFAYTGLVVEVDVSREGVGALLAPQRAYASQERPSNMDEMGFYPWGYLELNSRLHALGHPDDNLDAYIHQGVAYEYLGNVLDIDAMLGEHTTPLGRRANDYLRRPDTAVLNTIVYGVLRDNSDPDNWNKYLHFQLSDYGLKEGQWYAGEERHSQSDESYKSSWNYFRELVNAGERVANINTVSATEGWLTALSHAFMLPGDESIYGSGGVADASLAVMDVEWWQGLKSVYGTNQDEWMFATCSHVSYPIATATDANGNRLSDLSMLTTDNYQLHNNGDGTYGPARYNCFVKFLEVNETADEPYVIIGMQSIPFGTLGEQYGPGAGHSQEAQAIIKARLGGRSKVHKTPKLDESDVHADITEGNAAYTLAGAEYTYYTNQGCTQVAKLADGSDAKVVTDASGNTPDIVLPIGTYWVKETKASVGFKVDPVVHGPIEVKGVDSEGNNYTAVVESKEPPVTDPIQIQKVDTDALEADGSANAQGDATLGDTVFQVNYYNSYLNESQLNSVTPTRSWKIKTYPTRDSSGAVTSVTSMQWAYEDPEHYLVENDPNGFYLVRSENGVVKPEFPLGTISVREITPPSGYLSHDAGTGAPTTYYAHVVYKMVDGSEQAVIEWKNWDDATSTFSVAKNKVFTGGLDVKKVDSTYWGDKSSGLPDKKMETGQGDATLAGAKFRVYNVSDNAIYVGGERKESVGKVTLTDAQMASGKITWLSDLATSVSINDDTPYVAELTTDENGECHMDVGSLPYGTYVLREVSPPRGYTTGDKWYTGAVFAVREDKQKVSFSQLTSKGHYNGRDEWDESVTYEFGMRG